MKRTLSYYLLLFGQCLFLILFCILVIQIIFSMKSSDSIFNDISVLKMLLYAMGIGGILMYLACLKEKILLKHRKELIIIVWLFWSALQGIYIYATYSQTGSDSYVVNFFAWNITHNMESDSFFWQYFARYQNNVPLLLLLSGCYKLIGGLFSFEDSWIIIAIVSGLFADLAIFWTVKLSSAICECDIGVFFSFISALLLIGLGEEATVFYSDIIALWTIPCSLFFYFQAFKKHKKVFRNIILSAIVIGIGGVFKPQVFLVAVSIFIIKGLYSIHFLLNKIAISDFKYFVIFFSLMLVLYFCLYSTSVSWYTSILPEKYNKNDYLYEQKYPSVHWINMGLNEYYGSYSEQDVEFTGNILGLEEKKTALKLSIKQRLEDRSLKDLILYENRKVLLAIQNGTFSQDMVWKGTLLNESSLAQCLQHVFVAIYPEWKSGLGLIVQTLYIYIIMLCLYVVFRQLQSGRWFEESFTQVMTVTLIGGICFIILLERNMRYFYSLVPILIALSSKGIESIKSRDMSLNCNT